MPAPTAVCRCTDPRVTSCAPGRACPAAWTTEARWTATSPPWWVYNTPARAAWHGRAHGNLTVRGLSARIPNRLLLQVPVTGIDMFNVGQQHHTLTLQTLSSPWLTLASATELLPRSRLQP